MKRMLGPDDFLAACQDYTARLDTDQLVAFKETCLSLYEAAYTALAQPLSNAIFEGDIARQHILLPLGKTGKLSIIFKLRLVCKSWLAFTQTLSYVSLFDIKNHCHCIVYILKNIVPCATSCQSNDNILIRMNNFDHFKRIESLTLSEAVGYTFTCQKYIHAKSLPCLKTFSFRDCRFELVGLSELTQLTNLDISAHAFRSQAQLSCLTNLTSLRIHSLKPAFVHTLVHLTQLTYLHSDRLCHFTCYTGKGKLKGRKDPDYPHDLDSLDPCCDSVKLKGQWKEGVFTGHATIMVPGEYSLVYHYHGDIKADKRDGSGLSVYYDDNQSYAYDGEWKEGMRHGIADYCIGDELSKPSLWAYDQFIKWL